MKYNRKPSSLCQWFILKSQRSLLVSPEHNDSPLSCYETISFQSSRKWFATNNMSPTFANESLLKYNYHNLKIILLCPCSWGYYILKKGKCTERVSANFLGSYGLWTLLSLFRNMGVSVIYLTLRKTATVTTEQPKSSKGVIPACYQFRFNGED